MKEKKLVHGYISDCEEHLLCDAGAVAASIRKGLGLTQSDVGAMLGIGKAQVSKVESGGQNITTATIDRLYGALGTRLVFSTEPELDEETRQDVIDDLVMCVSEFAERNGLGIHAAFNYLDRHGAIAHYLDFNDIARSEDIEDTMKSFKAIARQDGGKI